uniref:Transmembrane BAX inhibitor motif containing 1a n=1 Tax=Oryzias latipes TaxID=8090 RepID=A0A3P9KJB8_ORYLA
MSKSDYPPDYNASHGPLYPPQGSNYPQPPAYGFPSYGGPQPGPLSAPYPSSLNAPLYPGQPAGYPPGPYPGQPQPGGPPGYPNPPPMPPVLPPTIPSDMISSGEEFAARGSNWEDLRVRHSFIRKVYLILASQLLLTTAIVAIFTFVHPVKTFVRDNPAVYWASYAIYIITHIVLVCCKGPRRKYPWNLILLLIFTLALSYMTGTISSFYDTKSVFLALGITAVVCIAVTVFCFQTKVDFTKCQGLFCVLGIVVFVTGIIAAIVLSFKYILWLHMLYAAIGAIVFTLVSVFIVAFNFFSLHLFLLHPFSNRSHPVDCLCLPVPGISHAAADRKQEVLHQ